MRPSQRSASNYRLYSNEDLHRLRFVRAVQATGFTLDDIKQLLRPARCDRVQGLIEARLSEVGARMRELRHVQKVLRGALDLCREHEESPELGPNIGVDSAFGVVDLDWYADVRTWNQGSPVGSDVVYVAGKLIWNAAKAVLGLPLPGHTAPYGDPKEATLLDAMRAGAQSFADFFPDSFMEKNCKDRCLVMRSGSSMERLRSSCSWSWRQRSEVS